MENVYIMSMYILLYVTLLACLVTELRQIYAYLCMYHRVIRRTSPSFRLNVE